MPLDPTRLALAIKTNLLNDAIHSQAIDNDALESLCESIAAAVITELTVNAVVLPTLLLAPPGTAGGPVTGTGKIS